MGDWISPLLALISTLAIVVDRTNLREEKKLARKILQVHLGVQTIIEDAERIFQLIENAEAEYYLELLTLLTH